MIIFSYHPLLTDPSGVVMSIVFRPLRCASNGPSEVFTSLRPELRDTVKVYIEDTEDVPLDDPTSTAQENVLELGEFKLVTEKSLYMESLIEEVSG